MSDSDKIKISIVTPSFNCASFIKETIDSVLMQGEQSLEHIVMDGGSTDATVDILKSYPHLSWLSEKDRGQSHALNKGFAAARGEIIGWLNADDTYEPGTFEKVVRFFDAHPEVDFIGTDIHIIDEQSKRIGFSPGKEFDMEEMLRVNTIKQPTVFMRKHMVKKLVGVDETLHFVMDHEYWVRAYVEGFRFKFIPGEVFANFRLVSGTKSYESAPSFYLEWKKTVEIFFLMPFFKSFSNKNQIIQEIDGQYYTALTVKFINEKNRKDALINIWRSLQVNRGLLLNRGFYKFLFLIILGKKRNLNAKYN